MTQVPAKPPANYEAALQELEQLTALIESGQLPLERAVQMMSSDTATHLGLRDRGQVRAGLRADLNIIDLDAISLSRPRLQADLPAGGKRLLQDAAGYRATLVKGVVIAENGRLTGERPGRLARGGAAARPG